MHSTTNHDAHYDQVLRDLVDMATDIARMIHAQITCQQQAATAALPPTTKPANDQFPDPTLAFDRISRTIRRTILLAKKLPSLGSELGHAQKPEDPTLRRIADRKRIIRQVEDVIQRNAKPQDLDSLQTELRERLDSPDLEDDIDHRPIQDIVADICRDLRVLIPYAPNYKRRTPAQVETLRAQAAAIPETWREQKPRLPPETPAAPRRPAKRANLYAVGYEESRNREGLG
jgi:hypothetical protein